MPYTISSSSRIKTNKTICFCTVNHPKYGKGGAEIQTYSLAKEFHSQGWTTFFLSKSGKKISDEFEDNIINNIEIKKFDFFSILFTLIRLKYQFNVKYFYYRFHKYPYGVMVIIGKLLGISFIWASMSDAYCGKNAATAYARSMNKHGPILFIKDLVFRFGVKLSTHVFVQNEIQSQIVHSAFMKKSYIFYSSTKMNKIDCVRKNRVLFIATMKFMKHPEIFCQVANCFRDKNISFEIIGKNYQDNNLANELLDVCKNSGVLYLGEFTLNDILNELQTSKLLINTSDFEGFPNTFVQSFSCGTPVISLNANPDGIFDKYDIGICCDGNIENISYWVTTFFCDNALWLKYSNNANNFASSFLNIEISVKKMSKILLNGQ